MLFKRMLRSLNSNPGASQDIVVILLKKARRESEAIKRPARTRSARTECISGVMAVAVDSDSLRSMQS
jgi:hypothetical protein